MTTTAPAPPVTPEDVYARLKARGYARVELTALEDNDLVIAVRKLAEADGRTVITKLSRLPNDVALRHRVLVTARPRIFRLEP